MKILHNIKSIYNDFLNYSFIYKIYKKWYKKRCWKKLQRYIQEDNCVSLYIGLPRSGKTTFIAYLTHLCNVTGYKCFCNVPVNGAYPYTKEDLGVYNMADSLILLDEAGIIYDNRMALSRDEKAFTDDSLRFLKLIGHYHSHIILFSQSMDIDVKWVRMSSRIRFVKRSLIPGFTSIYNVSRKLDVNPDTHKIEDFYEKEDGFLKLIFHFRFRRKPYYKMFDSYSAPKLREFPKIKKYEKYKFTKGDYKWNL